MQRGGWVIEREGGGEGGCVIKSKGESEEREVGLLGLGGTGEREGGSLRGTGQREVASLRENLYRRLNS